MLEPAKDPPSLVAVEGAVGLQLVLEDPLASHHIDVGRTRNKLPCASGEESGKLLFHGGAPVRISESSPVHPWEQREGVDVEVEPVGCLANAMLAASSHGVVVDGGAPAAAVEPQPHSRQRGEDMWEARRGAGSSGLRGWPSADRVVAHEREVVGRWTSAPVARPCESASGVWRFSVVMWVTQRVGTASGSEVHLIVA